MISTYKTKTTRLYVYVDYILTEETSPNLRAFSNKFWKIKETYGLKNTKAAKQTRQIGAVV